MDRFHAMQAFARVVETGSFTKAAETLHLSRATVTQLVQQLEAHLRVKLLNRTTRKVNVTPDGAAYYERVVRLLVDIDDAETSLPSLQPSPRGRLRVDVPSPFASMILIPALPNFHSKYPDIQLYLGASDREVDLIDENVDCVVRGGEVTDLSLVARHAADLPLAVYAAPSYLEQRGVPSHPRELELPHHCTVRFSLSTRRLFPHTIKRNGESVNVLDQPALLVDDGHAYLAAGLAGIGAVWLPTFMAQSHVARGELIPLFTDWHIDPLPMYVAFPQNRYISAKLRVFIDWLIELMALHAPVVSRPLLHIDTDS